MKPDHRHVVLFVDDCADLRDAFSRLLAARGHEVRAAASGVAALSMLAGGFRPCLVLLDQHMPGMTGADVQTRLRSHAELRAIPIVVMSGAAPATELAGSAVLVKPFDAADLFAAVDAHARCPAAPARAAAPSRAGAAAVRRHIEATLDELRARMEVTRDLRRMRARIVDRLSVALQPLEKRPPHT